MFLNMTCTSALRLHHCTPRFELTEVTNLTRTGLTICNTTGRAATNATFAVDTKAAPLIRVVTGNYALWGSNESLQCQWFAEKNNSQSGFADGFLSNGNRSAFSGLGSAAENPSKAKRPDTTSSLRACRSA